ncbi:hypothetical protein NL676_006241 [Syzygium grande]|nr:hypothetical protein NL676_006241 [Syzygium grande]
MSGLDMFDSLPPDSCSASHPVASDEPRPALYHAHTHAASASKVLSLSRLALLSPSPPSDERRRLSVPRLRLLRSLERLLKVKLGRNQVIYECTSSMGLSML